MTCSRVLIIHRGRIIASGTTEELKRRLKGGGTVRVEIRGARGEIEPKLRELGGVETVRVSQGADQYLVCHVVPKEGMDLRPAIYQRAVENRWALRELTRERQTLEDIFVELTATPRVEEEEEE